MISRKIRSHSFLGRLLTNHATATGLTIILATVIMGSLAPLLYPAGPFIVNLTSQYENPSINHPFGTDELGRDVLGRIVWSIRVTLIIGFTAAIIAALVGTILGSVAGYFGGWPDHAIMRLVDLMLSFPMFFLVLLIVLIFSSGIFTVMLVIGLTIWPNGARLIRSQFLSFKELEFVKAARIAGASDLTIIFKEILPNAVFPLVVDSSLRIGTAILTEAGLSFLGAGDPSQLSLGWMLNEAIPTFRSAWWTGVYPGLILSIILVAFNLLADGLNDALNVRLTQT